MSANSAPSISNSQRREFRRNRVLTLLRKQKATLDYEPPIFCKCGLKAPRWISWTDKHPGMRFYKCAGADGNSSCGFYKWVDQPVTGWVREVIMELRDREREMAERIADFEADNARLTLRMKE